MKQNKVFYCLLLGLWMMARTGSDAWGKPDGSDSIAPTGAIIENMVATVGQAPRAKQSWLVENVVVIDGTGSKIEVGVSVLIRDGRISGIGPELEVSDSVIRIDAKGKTVLPGLFDMHGHMYGWGADEIRPQYEVFAKLYLSGGVTTVFSPGSLDPEGVLQFRQQVEVGDSLGPRIHLAGRYIDRWPSQVSWVGGFKSADSALQYLQTSPITEFAALKIYSGTGESLARPVIEFAHKQGLFVTGHIGAMSVKQVIAAGIDGLEHGIFTMSELTGESEFRRHLCALSEGKFNRPLMREIIGQLAQKGVYITPTTVTFAALSGNPGLYRHNWLRFLSKDGQAIWSELPHVPVALPQEIRDCVDGAVQVQQEFVLQAYQAGVRILTGTDPIVPMLTPGVGIHMEIQYLLDAGLPIEAAIKAASLDAAEVLNVDESLGSIQVGKTADLLILDGNALTDSYSSLVPYLVFKGGRPYLPETIRASAELGIQ